MLYILLIRFVPETAKHRTNPNDPFLTSHYFWLFQFLGKLFWYLLHLIPIGKVIFLSYLRLFIHLIHMPSILTFASFTRPTWINDDLFKDWARMIQR